MWISQPLGTAAKEIQYILRRRRSTKTIMRTFAHGAVTHRHKTRGRQADGQTARQADVQRGRKAERHQEPQRHKDTKDTSARSHPQHRHCATASLVYRHISYYCQLGIPAAEQYGHRARLRNRHQQACTRDFALMHGHTTQGRQADRRTARQMCR